MYTQPIGWRILATFIAGLALIAVAQALPKVGHDVEIPMPSRLTVERGDSLAISFDLTNLRNIKITQGEGMTLGMKTELRVYAKGAPRPIQPVGIGYGSIPASSTSVANTGFLRSKNFLYAVPDGIPAAGKAYAIEEDISLFETDRPPRHMWSPEGSRKYKVLWRNTLKTTG